MEYVINVDVNAEDVRARISEEFHLMFQESRWAVTDFDLSQLRFNGNFLSIPLRKRNLSWVSDDSDMTTIFVKMENIARAISSFVLFE